jgi:phosphatidylglycerophosphatase C
MKLAVFDLDGTITRHDTLFPYTLGFCVRHPARFLRLWVMPWHVLCYFFTGRDRGRLKEALIIAVFRGLTRQTLAAYTERFVTKLLKRGVHPEALQRIEAHRRAGDHLVLMSASPELYVPAIARALGMHETICTGLAWDGLRLLGELTTANRQGEEKVQCVAALRQRFPKSHITAYGNSSFDLPHLRRVDHGYLVNGSKRTSSDAARLSIDIGWPHS